MSVEAGPPLFPAAAQEVRAAPKPRPARGAQQATADDVGATLTQLLKDKGLRSYFDSKGTLLLDKLKASPDYSASMLGLVARALSDNKFLADLAAATGAGGKISPDPAYKLVKLMSDLWCACVPRCLDTRPPVPCSWQPYKVGTALRMRTHCA